MMCGCGAQSPLARTKRTAEIIWDAREKSMVSLFDLREIDLYSFQVQSSLPVDIIFLESLICAFLIRLFCQMWNSFWKLESEPHTVARF